MIKTSLQVLILLAMIIGTIPLLGAYSASLVHTDDSVTTIETFQNPDA